MTNTSTPDLAHLESLKPNKENGAYIFNASGCSGCHMDPQGSNRLKLVGGKSFSTPFGLFYAPNISMSKDYGIGEWTLANFATAVQQGISPDGTYYYHSFPY